MTSTFKLPDFFHHAYYIIGGTDVHDSLITELEKKHKIKIHGNPDFSDRKYETFTIDDSRALKAAAEIRPASGGNTANGVDGGEAKKIFIIQMNAITSEAQNALLKLLEEPAEYVHFFLIVPSVSALLPTVRSRMSKIETAGEDASGTLSDAAAADAESFIKMSTQKRLDHIKKLMEDISKEKKFKQDAIDLLNAIQSQVYVNSKTKGGLQKLAAKLEAIEKARSYMNDRAPSLKMLLEYVSLSI
jgi:DNA polymerase III delta prime subunit